MIKTIIKRDGTKEDFSAEKINGWGEWASNIIGEDHIDWSSIVLTAVSTLPDVCTSEQLQDALIDACSDQKTWAYSRMAGRLYASTLAKQAFGTDKYPHIQELHKKMLNLNILAKSFVSNWSSKEYDLINSMLDHERDTSYPYYQLKQITKKYSLRDRTKPDELQETPQYVYMRVAMRLAMNKENRLEHIEKFYNYFSQNKISIPTPYFTNAGTDKSSFNSCCVYKTNDDVRSLAAGDHIAYTMTYSSAGIGSFIHTRSKGSKIRGGIISHRGKVSYYNALVGAIKANMQNGRGGAATVTYSAYDPDVFEIQPLKNSMTPVSKQVRGIDYSMAFNKFFAQQAAKNQDVFLFDANEAPEVYDALVKANDTEFERVYEQAVLDGKYRERVSARKVVLGALTESIETGRHYYTNLSEMNSHTPFKDPIYQSNLCLTGDTLLYVKNESGVESKMTLKELVNASESYSVLSYNHNTKTNEYKKVTAKALMRKDAKLMLVVDEYSGNSLVCTPDHKIYTKTKGYIQASNIFEPDSLLIKDQHPNCVSKSFVSNLKYTDDVYDITVEDNHNFYANDILVHNCQEIAIPTEGYKSTKDLYTTGYQDTVEGEVGMCSLAAVVPTNIESDTEYADVAYYCLLMIHTAIHEAEYELPHIGLTAKARNSAGVGLVDVAHYLASKNQKYDSEAGRKTLHELAETHYWHLVNASLKMSVDYGLAPWIHKTKWPDGYTPLDTYNKNVDTIAPFELKRDWSDVSKRIKENGGIHNSVLVAHMPAESSSIASGTTNGIYPIRNNYLIKTNDEDAIVYVTPDYEKYKNQYQYAWDIESLDMIKVYGIFQKFTDQGISADLWKTIVGADKIASTELLKDFFASVKYGMKSRYYINSKTSKQSDTNLSEADCEGCSI